MTNSTLRKGTEKCPNDGVRLHFAHLGGMRIYTSTKRESLYSARCPKCGQYFKVRREYRGCHD